jgi:hypothetical protein
MKGRHSLQKAALLLSLAASGASARADSLDLVNGDHYQGTVVSVTRSNVVFQSDVLGSLSLPRNKVAQINLGAATIPVVPKPATNSPASNAPVAATSLILQGPHNAGSAPGSVPQGDAVLQQMRQQGVDPDLVNAVQQQVFGQGNPAASAKFNELMGGLMSGKISVSDIRAQAQDSIQQIKDAKQQLGPEIGDSLDGYLAILQSFVNETATNTTVTASPPPASAPASTPASTTP